MQEEAVPGISNMEGKKFLLPDPVLVCYKGSFHNAGPSCQTVVKNKFSSTFGIKKHLILFQAPLLQVMEQ